MLDKMVKGRNIRPCKLADELGITRAAVSQQLKRGVKSMRVAKRYATVLKCNPLLLID